MRKLQPEGRHRPVAADDPMYRGAVRGVLVTRVRLDRVDGKAKLGQNRRPEEIAAVLAELWRRGAPGDPRAVELVRAANPDAPAPPIFRAPAGARLSCALDEHDVEGALALVAGAYWNEGVPPGRIARAHLGAQAWVGAHDDAGALVATARAVSDGAKWAWVYDVAVAPAWRARGLGAATMRLLLDHPAVRGAAAVRLQTRDAHPFYERLGFERRPSAPSPHGSTEMELRRALPAAAV
jgi:GNAT superfamily N-acetyltransferase